MNSTESVAQGIVEVAIRGCQMVYRSDQSQSVADFDLIYSGGRRAAIEVTAAVEPSVLETHGAILSRRRGGPRVKAELCKKTWRVHPSPNANINKIRGNLDAYLAEIESMGIEHFFSANDRHSCQAVEQICAELQIASGDVLEGQAAGFIGIGLPITAGPIARSVVVDAVEAEAWKADNRNKLASSDLEERHLFVFVDVLNDRVWAAFAGFPPPPESPDLPPEITHVWVAGPAVSGKGFVVWRATSGSGWDSVGPISIRSSITA
jgi:hypothetical protein